MIVYERAGLLFIFNFHPQKSFTDYRVGVDVPGEYTIILSSDEKGYGGFENVISGGKYLTTPLEWNGRKNWAQVRNQVASSGPDPLTWKTAGLRTLQDLLSARESLREKSILGGCRSLSPTRLIRCVHEYVLTRARHCRYIYISSWHSRTLL